MQPRHATALSVTLTLAALASAPLLSDPPLGGQVAAAAPGGTRAVLAIRDHVNPFQQLGTALFTRPALNRSYAEVTYITLNERVRWGEVYDAFEALSARHAVVDVLLLTHNNKISHVFDTNHRERLGLVYHTGCGNAAEADAWLRLGADTFIGHRGPRSASPYYYVPFLRRWLRGASARDAHMAANEIAGGALAIYGPQLVYESEALIFGAPDIAMSAP